MEGREQLDIKSINQMEAEIIFSSIGAGLTVEAACIMMK